MKFLTHTLLLAGVVFGLGCATTPTMTKEAQARVTPATAMERLKTGNERFVSGRSAPRNLLKQVAATSEGQYPFATVVSCLDSRTSAELIFDQGIGDIFNARVAGNVVNPDILGSLGFASKAAGSKLIAVIGHTKCGAVKGACDHVQLGNLTGLLQRIEPAVKSTPSSPGEDRTSKNNAFVDRVAESNVRAAMDTIRRQSPILREMERKGEIAIVGGMHDLETGRVTFLK
jgi:carbonic anhydrase